MQLHDEDPNSSTNPTNDPVNSYSRVPYHNVNSKNKCSHSLNKKLPTKALTKMIQKVVSFNNNLNRNISTPIDSNQNKQEKTPAPASQESPSIKPAPSPSQPQAQVQNKDNIQQALDSQDTPTPINPTTYTKNIQRYIKRLQ